MFIKHIRVGQFDTNCYILCDTITGKAVIIDPGCDAQRVAAALADTRCAAEYILLTHGHWDHMGAARGVQDVTGAKLAVPEKELPLLNNPEYNLWNQFESAVFTPFSPEVLLHDGDTLTAGGLEIRTLHTPGHTAGSCVFLCQDSLFTGDTLFKESVGRVDLPTARPDLIRESVNRLASLPGEYQVFPGHGEITTMSHERKCNPYIAAEGMQE